MQQSFRAVKIGLAEISRFRPLHLQEMNVQVRYNAVHERGWSDSYLLMADDVAVGYGAVHGKEQLADRDTVFEFYVVPAYRSRASRLFEGLLAASGAPYIEAQSNDRLMASMLYEFGIEISSDTVLFEDYTVTTHSLPGVTFRARREDDGVFEHTVEPMGDYVLIEQDTIVATGGFLLHYNMPFADVYMEVSPSCRRRGFGSLLVQEVKRECYLAGRVPAARTGMANLASRATLMKAGFRVAGFMLIGRTRSLAPAITPPAAP